MRKLRCLALFALAAGVLVGCFSGGSPPIGTGTGGTGGGSGTSGSGSQPGGGSTVGPGGSGTSGSATSNTGSGSSSTAGSSAAGASGGSAAGTGGSSIICGDGVRQGNEQCEPTDLNGAKCSTLGYRSGTLSCDKTTCAYDTSMCVGAGGGTGGTGH